MTTRGVSHRGRNRNGARQPDGVTNPQPFDGRQLFGAREVETVARALVLAQDLARLGYPGAGDVAAWLGELQTAITPAMPRP